HSPDARLGLARPVGAEHVEVQTRAQIPGVDDDLLARCHAADDVAAPRVVPRSGHPSELAGQAVCRLRAHVVTDAVTVTGGRVAASHPGAVQTAADDSDRAGVSR